MHVKTFGPVDRRSLEQLQRCMEAGDAEYGVLCADHHPGYSQPIGGAVAYEGYVSPSGVGYDIGCIARGARVTLDGICATPIEVFSCGSSPMCWDGRSTRPIAGNTMLLRRGRRETLLVRLVNGRSVGATRDHLIRTKLGWKEACLLRPGDAVACSPFVGMPRSADVGNVELDPDAVSPDRRARLEDMGLWPLRLEDARLPSLLRLLGFVAGDGHLHRDGKAVVAYTFDHDDASNVIRDVERLGVTPGTHVRRKAAHLKPEIAVRINSVAVHALLAALGCPVGKKQWPDEPMPWLLALPSWLRAQFLSGFASADMSSPIVIDGRLANLSIKQVATDTSIATFLARLLGSLGFRAGVSVGAGRAGRDAYAIQVLGGEHAQLRFLEQIGFCYSAQRRAAAARAASIAWQRMAIVARRTAAFEEARLRRAAGDRPSVIRRDVAARWGVADSLVFHALYGDRGAPRGPKGLRPEPDASGEVAWVAVESVEPGAVVEVFDVATEDAAQAFFAEGIVVHNCGNKAALTNLRLDDLEALGGVEMVMGEISRRISFGVGVPAQERVDHAVLDKIRDADFAPQRKLAQLAASQLGTVGSGNHYVNLMADESDRVWVGVHFGSRGFGHRTASGFLALAQGLPFDGRAHEGEMDSPPVLFEIGSELGESYIAAMELAGEYAYAGRDVVVDKVLEILGARAEHVVHNHHNFAWKEEHGGRTYWVVRKGCTPARPGQEGFVGGSMADESVILEGVESPENAEALYSTVHGAGRVMSRSQAAGRIRRRKRFVCRNRDCDRLTDGGPCPEHPDAGVMRTTVTEQVRPGLVDWPAVQARLRDQGIVLVGGGADEAPEVYKRLPEVLAAHAGTIRVEHTLRPLGVAMAGRDVHDPYKD